MRNISSPKRVASVCNNRKQQAGNTDKRKFCSGFGERVRQLITEKSSVTGNPLET